MKKKYKYDVTKEYTAWVNMKRRCSEIGQDRVHYFEKGITVCDEWKNSYKKFLEDIGLAPSKNHEIDRIDNSSGYYKENVRWVTRSVNCYNKTHDKNQKRELPRGVYKWPYSYRSQISINGTIYRLGHFKTAEEARLAYEKISIEWFGSYCKE